MIALMGVKACLEQSILVCVSEQESMCNLLLDCSGLFPPCGTLKAKFIPIGLVPKGGAIGCRETQPDWDKDIAEDVKEECGKFGSVNHVYVDRNSKVRNS